MGAKRKALEADAALANEEAVDGRDPPEFGWIEPESEPIASNALGPVLRSDARDPQGAIPTIEPF